MQWPISEGCWRQQAFSDFEEEFGNWKRADGIIRSAMILPLLVCDSEKRRSASRAFHMAAAHGDSPCFKIKKPELTVEEHYLRLNTEKYGGMILSTWLDRPLSIAGRLAVKN